MDDITKIPHMKGNSLRLFFQVIAEHKGQQVLQEVLEQLPHYIREAHQFNSIMPSAWYPVSWLCDSYATLRQVTREGVELSHEMGYLVAMMEFRGVYKIFFRLLKPETLLEKSSRLFPKFFSMGKQEILESKKGFARSKWVCPGFDANLWGDTYGTCRAALELCGAHDIHINFRLGGGDGDTISIIDASWE